MFTAPDLDAAERTVLQRIAELREDLQQHLRSPRRWDGSLRRMSFARNVQGSNSIEGIHASVDDVAAIGQGDKPASVDEETTKALVGYQQAMTFVLQLAKEPPITVTTQLIRSLHFMLVSYDLDLRPGLWRAGPIFVREEASGDIVHEGADISAVASLMEATAAACDEGANSIIRGAMAHLNLVLVHPFRDGNGRMARVLQSLVLASDGELAPVFMSVEEYLGAHTQAYYDVLARVGGGRWEPAGPETVRPWIRFILTAHLNQAEAMLARYTSAEHAAVRLDELVSEHSLPERTLGALYDAVYGLSLRRSTYLAALREQGENISDLTASRDLNALAGAGILTAHGEKRGRFYTASPLLERIREDSGLGRTRTHIDPFA